MSVWTHHGEYGKLKHSCAGFAAGETPGECHTGAQSTAVVVRALPVKVRARIAADVASI